MSFKILNAQDTNKVFITENGSYRILLGKPATSFSVLWGDGAMPPAGTLTFSVDGDPGESPGTIDLSKTGQAGSRTKVMNMSVWVIDIEVSGLPSGGCFTLMCGG